MSGFSLGLVTLECDSPSASNGILFLQRKHCTFKIYLRNPLKFVKIIRDHSHKDLVRTWLMIVK